MFNINKRAQIAETITWTVATLIIIFILIVSIGISSYMGSYKTFPITHKSDLFAEKSLTAYLLTNDANGVIIYNNINQNGQLNDFEGGLAQQIFTDLYSGYYVKQVFLGIATGSGFCLSPINLLTPQVKDFFGSGYCTYANNYFPISPSVVGSNAIQNSDAVAYVIYLINNKYVQLVLWH